MPVNEGIVNGYLQLGLGGAALLIVLVSVILNSTSNKKVDKLCDKIDTLVTTITKDMTANDKDSKDIKNKLDTILNVAIDSQRRITRIDDRTYRCLGNMKKEKKEVS